MSAMAVDQRPQSHLAYDSLRYQSGGPQFTNPWAGNSNGAPAGNMYHQSSLHQHSQPHHHAQQPHHQPTTAAASLAHSATPSRTGSLSMGYAANPAASTMATNLVPSRSYEPHYSSAPKLEGGYATAAAPPRHSPEQVHSYSPYGYEADISRRSSYQHSDSSRSYSDALDASRGMVAMSQSAYGPSRNGSQDSYVFPSNHSTHSSISSSSAAYPYYPNSYGSVDNSSMTDYSSASEDTLAQRTLPAPNQLISGFPPDQNTMMNQFNSKLAPNAQKKHKCKICDKRFTRPSSLQTHMYSHTGEKPFACDHEGCGRHFSVVSNLRRHKKVHKEDGVDSASPEDME